MVKQYALKIEYLLRIINPQRKYGCDDIELNPYMAIFQELNGRISSLLLERFIAYHKAIEGKSLLSLISSNYNIEKIISDLEDIVNKYLKEIN